MKATKTNPHSRFEFVAHSAAVAQAERWLAQGYLPTIKKKREKDRNGIQCMLFVVERGKRA